MDTQHELQRINGIIIMIDAYERQDDDSGNLFAQREARSTDDRIRESLVIAKAVARAAGQDELQRRLVEVVAPFDHHWAVARKALVDLRAHLRSQDEIAAIIGPQGPQLAAERMHDRIWQSAAILWSDGHPRQAIQTAATSLESQLQAKLNRPDKTGRDLAQGFSLNPPNAEWSRLRIPELAPGSATYTSAHQGAEHMVRGAFLLIRNLASHHGAPEPTEAEALEQLAVLSLLARLVDSCGVETRPTSDGPAT